MPGTPPTRFVYLGPEGTFTEQALRTIPAAEHGIRTPARSVPEALEAVRAGEADAALVPLENSVGGAVPVTLDELATGEPAGDHPRGGAAGGVRCSRAVGRSRSPRSGTVAAHPQASAQCRNWLLANLPGRDGGRRAVQRGRRDQRRRRRVRRRHLRADRRTRNGLTVLADKIADHADAVTRFALLSRPGAAGGADRRRRDVAGGLDRARPGGRAAGGADRAGGTRRQPDPHRVPADRRAARARTSFFLDCTGHVAEPRLGEALQGLRRICADVRFLG